MKGKLGEPTRTMAGEIVLPFITRDPSALALWDNLHEYDVRIDVKRWRERRSLDQNGYFHVLCNQIAGALRISESDCKRRLVLDYGTLDRDADGKIAGAKLPASIDICKYYNYAKPYNYEVIDGRKYTSYVFYKPTHEMDSAEMSRLIDGTIEEAKLLGIETLPPHELKAMEARANARKAAEAGR